VKAERRLDAIALWWQPRTVTSAGRVQTLDADGRVTSDVPLARVKWADPWVSAGEVPLDDAFVEWTGVQRFDACVYGTMRHLSGLLACGFGDTPEEVVGWFGDMGALQWIVEGVLYRIEGGDEFDGIDGSVGKMEFDEDNVPVFNVGVGSVTYPIRLDTGDLLRSVLCSVFPQNR